MKIKVFFIALISFSVILLGSGLMLYIQIQTLGDVNLNSLEENLYKENTEILAWSLETMEADDLKKTSLPQSWAEIMIVNNKSLVIETSTDKNHIGLTMYKLPNLLDQASGLIEAMKNHRSANIKTREYMVAISPISDMKSLMGYKPKSWERNLVEKQNNQISQSITSTKAMLLIYLAVGLIVSLFLSLTISLVITKPTQKVVEAFEQLSLGNFDVDIPRSGGKVLVSFSESFFRLKTSLKMALERLGRK